MRFLVHYVSPFVSTTPYLLTELLRIAYLFSPFYWHMRKITCLIVLWHIYFIGEIEYNN
jgi:hypothetical protein